jgi:hypothetical protein
MAESQKAFMPSSPIHIKTPRKIAQPSRVAMIIGAM